MARIPRVPVEVEHAILASFPGHEKELFRERAEALLRALASESPLAPRDHADVARAVRDRYPDDADAILSRMEETVAPPAVWVDRGGGSSLERRGVRADGAVRDASANWARIEAPGGGWRAETSFKEPAKIFVRDPSGALLQELEIELPPVPHDSFEVTLLAATRERLVTVDSGGEDEPMFGGYWSSPTGFARLRIWTIGEPDARVMAEPIAFADTYAGALTTSPDGELAAVGAAHARETWIVRLADAALMGVVPSAAERLMFAGPRLLVVQNGTGSRLWSPD